MRSAFKCYKLLKLAMGEEKMPQEGDARDRWIEKSVVLYDLILQSVNNDIFQHIKDLVELDDSRPKAWKLLRDVIQPNTLPMVIVLEKELAALSMRPGDDVKPVLDKIKDTYARMATAGSNVSQMQQCTKIISVLDNSWDNLIPTLNTQQDQWTPEWLRQQIPQEDFRKRHTGGGVANKTAKWCRAARGSRGRGGGLGRGRKADPEMFLMVEDVKGTEGDVGSVGKVVMHPLTHWVIDSGCTSHMTPRADLLDEVKPPGNIKFVAAASGALLPVIGVGNAKKSKAKVTFGPASCRAKLGKLPLWDLEEKSSCIKDLWQLPIIHWNGKLLATAAAAATAKAIAGGEETAPSDGALDAVKKVQQPHGEMVKDGSLKGLEVKGAVKEIRSSSRPRQRPRSSRLCPPSSEERNTSLSRYDVALNINTLGPRRLLAFAKQCRQPELLVHVVTLLRNDHHSHRPLSRLPLTLLSFAAFVNGQYKGRCMEQPFSPGDTMAAKLLTCSSRPSATTTASPAVSKRQEGRARRRGGGICGGGAHVRYGSRQVGAWAACLALALVRPSIVESALCEPMPGWIEGFRVLDPILMAYGKGAIPGFLSSPDGIYPSGSDLLSNAILAIAASNAKTPHMSSTSTFSPSPSPSASCTSSFSSTSSASSSCSSPISSCSSTSASLKYQLPRVYHVTTSVANPLFDSSNTDDLFTTMSPEERKMFDFNVHDINWNDYMCHVHIPGLRKKKRRKKHLRG
ncbi:unnamed protein product [Closterium sp. NIES-53]